MGVDSMKLVKLHKSLFLPQNPLMQMHLAILGILYLNFDNTKAGLH